MRITICDVDGCGKTPTITGRVIDPDSDWMGMEFDLCGNHDSIGLLFELWEKEAKEDEIEAIEA